MDSQDISRSVASLRAATLRLSSTSSQQLPLIVPQLSAVIWRCRGILSTPVDTKQKGEISVTLHRFKTKLSSLLQDRTVHGRWAAVVLAKAAIEAGGHEVLSKSHPWVQNLLGILKRPGPSTIRNLAVIALTRIFTLTWSHAELIREITTPAVPGFITTCLNNATSPHCSAKELQAILEAFATLVPRHATIFRTSESRIRQLLTEILSASSSYVAGGPHYPQAVLIASCKLLVLLHHCAPKQSAGARWSETLSNIVVAAHVTCDRILRAVRESWIPAASSVTTASTQHLSAGEVELVEPDSVGLKPWKGTHAGADRLICLLQLLVAHTETSTTAVVSFHIGAIANILSRLFAVSTVPPGSHGDVRLNSQFSKEEQDDLFTRLPEIHAAGLKVTRALIVRFGSSMMPLVATWVDEIISTFESDRFYETSRVGIYETLRMILDSCGPSLSKSDISRLSPLIKAGCEDILPRVEGPADSVSTANGRSNSAAGKTESTSRVNKDSSSVVLHDLQNAAKSLIWTAYLRMTSIYIPPKLRAQMDRTVVLSRDKDGLLASTLNPPVQVTSARQSASLLPILAREFPKDVETELFLRPRLPLVTISASADRSPASDSQGGLDSDGDEDETANSGGLESPNELIRRSERVKHQQDHYSTLNGPQSVEKISGPDLAVNPDPPIFQQERRHWPEKRSVDEMDAMTDAKRLRVSPSQAAETYQEQGLSTRAMRVTSIPAIQDEPLHENIAVQTFATDQGADGLEDDGSDLELPPLTLEPDTESEDNEEDT